MKAECVKPLPNVHSVRVSAPLLAVGVVSQGNPTWAATCYSTEGRSCSGQSQVSSVVHCRSSQPSPPPSSTCSLCRCKFASCTQSFLNAGKLKRHVQYSHGDKNKYFKVCVATQMCPQDGAKVPLCTRLITWQWLLLTLNHFPSLSHF